jgi:hypothetical protein
MRVIRISMIPCIWHLAYHIGFGAWLAVGSSTCGVVKSGNEPRLFLDVDPRTLRLPSSRVAGADPAKLQRQIARHGISTQGMPALEVYRGSDGELMIYDGVTRATRVAKLIPDLSVRVEVIDDLSTAVGHFPTVEDMLP